jgi:hypothetical protein
MDTDEEVLLEHMEWLGENPIGAVINMTSFQHRIFTVLTPDTRLKYV